MKLYTLKRVQKIPVSLNEAWDFFSFPTNLKKITPDYMGFDIISDIDSQKIYPGMIIIYTVRPLFNIPVRWVTEITHVQAPNYFVDEQRLGPYGFWHHKHYIKEVSQRIIEMIDLVHYGLPFGFFGNIAHAIIVRRKLEEIFNYRSKKVDELFGSYSKKQDQN